MWERVIIPGIASKPGGYTRHVAELAGASFIRSRRNVPIAVMYDRSACYFGNSNAWALFRGGTRLAFARTPIGAAYYLVTGKLPANS